MKQSRKLRMGVAAGLVATSAFLMTSIFAPPTHLRAGGLKLAFQRINRATLEKNKGAVLDVNLNPNVAQPNAPTFGHPIIAGIGGTGFSPIVNYPEVAILGLSRSSMEPVWMNGKFEPRQVLPLSLSYDHRLIDGADAARFLRWIAEAFEQPFLLSVQG